MVRSELDLLFYLLATAGTTQTRATVRAMVNVPSQRVCFVVFVYCRVRCASATGFGMRCNEQQIPIAFPSIEYIESFSELKCVALPKENYHLY